jgi:hypothetical protein
VKDPGLLNVLYEEIGHWQPRRLPWLRSRREGEGLILSFADPGHAIRRHTLNRMSRLVLDLCDGERRVDEIFESMVDQYPALPAPRVAEHVLRALRLMERKGILHLC